MGQRMSRHPAEEQAAGMVMAGPAVAALVLFVTLPFLLAVVFSFTNLRLGSPLPVEFVGLVQFRRILGDAAFRHALFNNALFAVVVVPVQSALALGAALLLNQRLRGITFFRAGLFLPVVFPMALIAVVWELLYAPGPTGALNSLLETISFGAWGARDFLRDPQLAMPSIMVLSIWQGMGFQMVILLAALQAIPEELYEAASLDGAGRFNRFAHITLPQLRNALVFVGMVTTILAFRLFDQVQILTRGGPERRTTTVLYEAVTAAFTRQQIARASAMSVVFFLIVLGLTLLWRRGMRE
jgi:multiple sugar transport system permease protein